MDTRLEAIVRAYVEQAGGDHERALREAVSDALADLLEAERRSLRAERLVSNGYVRSAFGAPGLDKQEAGGAEPQVGAP
jgi:hypothetical protein